MPNKNKILEYLDDLSPAAKFIGAVNTVENRNGRLIGHNTDGVGFMRSVREEGISAAGKTITLMGIGGAAAAICAQAALDGVKISMSLPALPADILPEFKTLPLSLKHPHPVMYPCMITKIGRI